VCPVSQGTGLGCRPTRGAPARLPWADGFAARQRAVARKGFVMAKNIYVGNLVWDATQDDLYNLFQEHGKVTRAQVIMDRETGRSRGFGFVEMENDSEADKAVDALNGADFRGRPLTVNEANPWEDRGGGGGAGGGSRGFGGGRSGGAG